MIQNKDPQSDADGTYFASIGQLEESYAQELINKLVDRVFIHQITAQGPMVDTSTSSQVEPATSFITGSRYNAEQFHSIIIDTGASSYSTARIGQFEALQRSDRTLTLDQNTKGAVTIQFGIGILLSIGSASINTPIGQVTFYVIFIITPFLLSLKDMDDLKVYFNNLTNRLITPNGSIPAMRRFGYSFLLWNTFLYSYITDLFDTNPCYLTDTELRRLYRRFGHPSVTRLQTVLERAGYEVDKEVLEYFTKFCKHY
jgi:hypothetical protein